MEKSARRHPKTLLLALLPLICPLIHEASGDYPFRNVTLPWEERVDNLVSLLTLSELQVQMAYGGHGSDVSPAPAIPRLGVGPYSWNTECLRGDVNAGPATSFPQALGLAATFSPNLVERVGLATGAEVRAKYNNYTQHGLYGDHRGLSCFSPVINIMRDPRWGRNQETYGEDPCLSGVLGGSFVIGLQSEDDGYIMASAGCKHFDVHGGPENIPESRFSFDAKVSDVDWHMTFLPAFRACVKAGTYSVMCSYNSINGVPACANKKLLKDILRNEWGFKGYVVSDQSALERLITDHHYVSSNISAAVAALQAGVNLEVSKNNVDGVFMNIVEAVNEGLIEEDAVRQLAKPLFYTRMRLGEFDPPSMNPYNQLNISLIQSPAHQRLSLEAAVKSIVLLKNKDGFLPINRTYNKVAVVGPMSNNASTIYGDANKSPTVDPEVTVTPLKALGTLARDVTSAEGCDDVSCDVYDSDAVKSAVHDADVVFVCLGTGHWQESEGNDRADLELPGQQLQLLKDSVTFSGGAPLVLLLFNASPLNVTWADEQDVVTAILECFFPAQTTGTAILHVLTNYGGTSSPAARLPNTWPRYVDDIPPMVDYSMTGRTYRYFGGNPLYPFGYGLSYSSFSYSDLKAPQSLSPNTTLYLSFTLTNTGQYTADEVTQVYVSWNNKTIPTPREQLVDFTRTTLTPGKPTNLTFTVPPENFAVYWKDGWVFPPGIMRVCVGGQQPDQQRSVGSNVLCADVIMKNTQPSFKVVTHG